MAADKFRPHHPEELAVLLGWCEGKSSILEVGSRYGFTLMEMAKRSGAKTIVSVDLPGAGDWGNEDSELVLQEIIQKLQEEGRDAHLFLGDSKDPAIIKSVKELGPFDLIFIDGDHRYAGAKADWLNYGPIGKTVVFHDIIEPKPGENQNLQVWKLWREIEGEKTEFIGRGSKMGIGRLG